MHNNAGLYQSTSEHDACGIGFIANLKGEAKHEIIHQALHMLVAMDHRGGCGCDAHSGDGAGILMQKPHTFFQKWLQAQHQIVLESNEYGVAQIFLPKEEDLRLACKKILQEVIERMKCSIIAYREVPVDNSQLGGDPLDSEPMIEQLFIKRADGMSVDEFERKLFVIRNHATHRVQHELPDAAEVFYIVSCSYKTIGYKGQFNNDQLQAYYRDFTDVDFTSLFVLVHSRFSTNTFPKWKLAQPFRYIAHNGEINTIQGNVTSMKAREALLQTTNFSEEEMSLILPVCSEGESDSANLDMAVEMLVLSGRPLAQVLMMLIPEAWQDYPEMEEHKRHFYKYYAHLMEPWDGPASICFSDGKVVGATLDRNGLRPSRYCLTKDGTLVMSSEVGVLDIDASTVVQRGRLQPGKMFIADLKEGRIIPDDELKKTICSAKEYGKWIEENEKTLDDFEVAEIEATPLLDADQLLTYQQMFGYTTEDVQVMIAELAANGVEPLGSMGLDTALPVLSNHAQHISNYFKQLFAQVTNPPIDPIREKTIMSLFTYLGGSKNLLTDTPAHCDRLCLSSPLLGNQQLASIKMLQKAPFISASIDITFDAKEEEGILEEAIDSLCFQAVEVVENGATIVILSDRNVSASKAPIPSLMALGAVHNALIEKGLRIKASLILESADIRETHHVATAVGYGANAVNPYLAIDTLRHLCGFHEKKEQELYQGYVRGVEYGLRKILSKMGISTLQSYHGSHIFEALGLSQKVVDKCFTGTVSNIGGLSFDDLANEALTKHRLAFPTEEGTLGQLPVGGIFQWKRRGEYHLFNPSSVHYLQQAARTDSYEMYKKYAAEINEQSERAATLRGLLTFTEGNSIPIEEVESATSILKRFATGAMSFGSISHEAHSTLAIAMNRIGAKSNSGEGGEDTVRFEPMPNGDSACSAIKQVASGRFGVTSYYLSQAKELQIKMAQGAKPGEGGQLPGHKVDEWIGRVRHSTPGVGLISPPPHHDIYSIEDLAQLIFDLKNANRDARINVKLVSEAGVGTIAAGVAKGYADVVLIAGHDGGTGASPLTSIRHAGLPWELGLSETHQTLVRNGLRSRIVVQADGQMKTGRDLVIATLLGAEEWGVATAALVAEGCILMRKCHLNTCPVGVATQDPVLRKRFTGKPEHIVSFFNFLVEELREIMAELGFRTINEMVGRVDRLQRKENILHWKAQKINFDKILYRQKPRNESDTLYCSIAQKNLVSNQIDWKFVEASTAVLEGKQSSVKASFQVHNTDRAIGTLLSHEVSKRYQQEGLSQASIHLSLQGSAGQSFGAFGASGVTIELEGEANDYVGKGLSGAQLIIYPFAASNYVVHQNMIIGNVALYGATRGELYASGMAGERFAVRNSGATAVVEGVGDHGCEYMTGGTVVILGTTGRNFAAGMSGGIAYIYDTEKVFASSCNMSSVGLESVTESDADTLKRLIAQHAQYTKSVRAKDIINNWENEKEYFVKVMPTEYKKVLKAQAKKQDAANHKKQISHG